MATTLPFFFVEAAGVTGINWASILFSAVIVLHIMFREPSVKFSTVRPSVVNS